MSLNNNNANLDSIFIKQNEINPEEKNKEKCEATMLCRKEVANMIPKDCLKQRNIELMKTKTEWRWRIFKMPGYENEIVEITQKKPGQKRLYINKNGEWVNYDLSEDYDIYVIHEYYHYV